jgi:hypothetical protein
MSNQLDDQRGPKKIPNNRVSLNSMLPNTSLLNRITDVAHNAFDSITGTKSETVAKPIDKPQALFSIVARVAKDERKIVERLSSDYAETFVSVVSKSLHLYNAIVEAAKDGGKLVMLRRSNRPIDLCGSQDLITNRTLNHGHVFSRYGMLNSSTNLHPDVNANSVEYHEAAIAVREQFAEHGKTPITLNRIYIDAPKGPKTERIAIKADSEFVNVLEDLERKTGSNRSVIIRHSLQLYNFVKRQHENTSAIFFLGDIEIDGI